MKLIELRKQNNLTQLDLANYLKIARTTYSAYEQKANTPDIETLKKLSQYYNVSLDYLCDNENANLVDISNWNENKKGALFLLEQLNERNDIILLGYLTHMIAEQKAI